ncbi:bifunctional UDP-sugar hydrolase/5'-nucleotidase UshA [Pasteurellaceae bacterium LIM206]|nr:bifunctional UDP-sugar hydrolase/5'-nucleotidase UshA [Pasteurellaceae bacterium LIM206]
MLKHHSLKISILALGLFSTAVMAYQAGKTYQFTVLHTNDLHGHFWPNEKGEYGLAAQKTVVDRVKKEVEAKGGSVILLNAGDINTGVPESDLQNARPDIEGLNAIGYEAMTLGNHEFDNPLQLLEMQEKWAKFPLLAANVYNGKTHKLLVKPYTILHKQDLKVAVVGLTTEDTAKLGNPEYIGSVRFADPTRTAEKVLGELAKNEKPDVKIALTHMGYYYDANHGSNAPGDVSMARKLPKGAFDIIVGGHTHDTVCVDEKGVFIQDYQPTQPCTPEFQNGTWIMQAGEWGKYLGRADFEFKNGGIELVKYELIPINLKKKTKTADGKPTYVLYGEEIPQDTELAASLKTYQDRGDKLLNVKVGELKGKLEGDRHVIRFRQTNLGHLVAEAQRQKVKADVGIMNSGGIRNSILAGEVTYKDILKVQPFGNIISYADLTSAELLDFLNVVALKEVDSGAYAQYSNITMTVNRAAKKVENVKIGGQPLDLKKIYRISLPSYNAAGGDGYPVLTDKPTYVNSGFVDADILKEYFEKNSPVDAGKFEPKDQIIYR